jgi:hypothetical protein
MPQTFKPPRLGPQLLARAQAPEFLEQVHVIFGGTGAVGGAAVLHLVGLLEEARAHLARHVGGPLPEPRLVVTGRTRQEVRQFTSLLFRLQQRDHAREPERLDGEGYRTARGVVVELGTFAVDPSLEDISGFAQKDESSRRAAATRFLSRAGLSLTDSPAVEKAAALEAALRAGVGRPFSAFLRRYREQHGAPRGRFRSVIVSIPLASLAAYKLTDLEQAGPWLGVERAERLEELKDIYLRAIRDDLAETAEELADEVLAAHTTAVGGMYDVDEDGARHIRLGFAHSALDDRLRKKQEFAEKLTRLYAKKRIKMLITAAAIGIDAVLVRKTPPWNHGVRARLAKAAADGTPVVPAAHLKHGLHVYSPRDVDLLDEEPGSNGFDQGWPLVLGHVLRSGENGYFTVANGDALYRVMRVTSTGELGLLLARTALLGDDRNCPAFPDNVCYYRESDNSRQVFDLLAGPELRANQLAGLQPKALQDLGSAKHQAELHILGLLILLHRLKTLHLEALPRHVDLRSFDAAAFFERHSRALTLGEAAAWDAAVLARELRTLVSAREPGDLAPLRHVVSSDPAREQALGRVLRAVIRAVWAAPSIGTPLVYEERGRRRALVGPYVASIDRVLASRDVVSRHLRERFAAAGGGSPEEFERFVEFHVANFGFADLRAHAVLVTARSDEEPLEGRVHVFRDAAAFATALRALEPYSYFATGGLMALLLRLRGLVRLAHDFDLRLGSANEFRAHLPRDERGHALLVPGVVEAFRMVSEGLEKTTGLERLDGRWGYYLP